MPVEISLSEIHESGSAGKTIAQYIEPCEAISYGWVCVSSQRRFPSTPERITYSRATVQFPDLSTVFQLSQP